MSQDNFRVLVIKSLLPRLGDTKKDRERKKGKEDNVVIVNYRTRRKKENKEMLEGLCEEMPDMDLPGLKGT